MKSKLYSVRASHSDAEKMDAIFAQFPNSSGPKIMIALVLGSGRIGVANALAKYAVGEHLEGVELEE